METNRKPQPPITQQIAGLHITGSSQDLDTLASFCAYYHFPLYTTNDGHYPLLEKYFPHLQTYCYSIEEISGRMIRCAGLFSLFDAELLERLFALPLQKKQKTLFIFRLCGNSLDSLQSEISHHHTISLTSGFYAMEKLQKSNEVKSLCAGNVKYAHYLANQRFYANLLSKKTHRMHKNLFTIFVSLNHFDRPAVYDWIKQAYNVYNFIIPVDRTQTDELPKVSATLEELNQLPNVLLTEECIPMHALMSQCDIFLGDENESAYDFLAYDHPLILLDHEARSPLLQCAGLMLDFDFPQALQLAVNQRAMRRKFAKKVFNPALDKQVLYATVEKTLKQLQDQWTI